MIGQAVSAEMFENDGRTDDDRRADAISTDQKMMQSELKWKIAKII